MKNCVFCHELIMDKGHKVSSLYTFDKKGVCCCICYELYIEPSKYIIPIIDAEIGRNIKNHDLVINELIHEDSDLEIIKEEHNNLLLIKKNDKLMLSVFFHYKNLIEGLDTNFKIRNIYGDNLKGPITFHGTWIVTYNKKVDNKVLEIWRKKIA
jgi:hypothetical protein